jgi:hypothetical protein
MANRPYILDMFGRWPHMVINYFLAFSWQSGGRLGGICAQPLPAPPCHLHWFFCVIVEIITFHMVPGRGCFDDLTRAGFSACVPESRVQPTLLMTTSRRSPLTWRVAFMIDGESYLYLTGHKYKEARFRYIAADLSLIFYRTCHSHRTRSRWDSCSRSRRMSLAQHGQP